MQQRRSPPKHRHDGTSPLPLGMDWSPPPRKWNGRGTVWPHDPHTGWSYCVTIPSWVVLPKSRNSDPVVFYRVQVGLQSPDGITTTSGVLRRFNDFLKLFNDLKKAFPKKNLPPTPPKGLLRMKSQELLEERRCSLEAWMIKLLSDIDISRSVAVASFLELESAARSSFQDTSQHSSEANSLQSPSHPTLPAILGSSSITSDYGSDTAYETSDLGTPRLGRDDSSELGIEDLALDEDLTSPIEKLVKFGMTNIDEGLFMGQTILEQLEGLPKHKMHGRHVNNVTGKDLYNGSASKPSILARNGMELFSQPEHGKVFSHARKLSDESVGSDVSSLRGSDMSNSGVPNSIGDGTLDLLGGADVSRIMEMLGSTELQTSGSTQVVLPLDQRPKLNRVMLTMQQRLVTAKTDMEDLIARLNQEIAVKDYLSTKVKDLEVELETTRQKTKENLQQAILVERERFTKMQWDMEELRRKSLEMELKMKSEQDNTSCPEAKDDSTIQEKDISPPELDSSKEQLENLSKRYEELEAKSKADIKVLVKEVKSLRSSQAELRHELSKSLKEKSESELLQREQQRSKHAETAREKLLQECKILHKQLQECNTNFPSEGEDNFVLGSLIQEASDLLTTSDNRINQLLSEAQLLEQDNRDDVSDVGEADDVTDDTRTTDDELRKMLVDIFTENASLRKQVNSVIRHALKVDIQCKKDDVPNDKLH
ncbi:PX domain-containing protein EREL1 isoform X2 [Rosa chinensis]|uniref:PX domain-containing protein EREL1 isoform X2 n=1 Tax=Rosa chinensis TaxID=74649 RepID=UPI000D0965E9|nr:PX domain-containing protein EREL1 isoform X2 [Rosa chinensis]